MIGPARPAPRRDDQDVGQEVRRLRDALPRRIERWRRLDAWQRSLALSDAKGVTGENWRSGGELRSAWSLLEVWRGGLETVDGLLEGRHGRRDMDRIAGLLFGDAVRLTPAQVPTPEGGPPGGSSSTRHHSLRQVAEFVDDSLSKMESLLGGIAEIVGAAQRLSALLEVSDASGDAVGSGSGDERVSRESAARICREARSDPLGFGVGRVAEAETLFARRACARLASAVNRLEAREAHSRARLASAGVTDSASLPQAAAGLHEALRALERRCDRERRSDPPALARLAERIAVATGHAGRAGTRTCVRTDCGGGVLDEDGMCARCRRAPRRGERG